MTDQNEITQAAERLAAVCESSWIAIDIGTDAVAVIAADVLADLRTVLAALAAADGPQWREKPTVAGLWWIPLRGVERIREQHLPSWAENIEPIYGPLPDQPKGGA
jgi:hypothetical protein